MVNSLSLSDVAKALSDGYHVRTDIYQDSARFRTHMKVIDAQNNFQYNISIDDEILGRNCKDEYYYKDLYREFEYKIIESRKKLGVDEVTGKKYMEKYIYKPRYIIDPDELDKITKSIDDKNKTIQPNMYDAFGEERRQKERKQLPKYGRY